MIALETKQKMENVTRNKEKRQTSPSSNPAGINVWGYPHQYRYTRGFHLIMKIIWVPHPMRSTLCLLVTDIRGDSAAADGICENAFVSSIDIFSPNGWWLVGVAGRLFVSPLLVGISESDG
jgi:hypothetical protein